jgi:hypothetical protein
VLREVDGPDPAPLGLGDERLVGLPAARLRVVEQTGRAAAGAGVPGGADARKLCGSTASA